MTTAYQKRHAEKAKRTDERNAWIKALRESVGEPPRSSGPRA